MKPINWLVLFVIGLLPVAGLIWTFQTDPQLASPGENENTWIEPLTAMHFVRITWGCEPSEKACPNSLWMGRDEVTNLQYQRFQATHSSRVYREESLNAPSQPVVYVSWEDAQAFAQWLTEQHQGKYRFRLPEGQEWDRACGVEGDLLPWNEPRTACSFASVNDAIAAASFGWTQGTHPCNDNFTVSAPVGSFPANQWGLFDLLGNVAEWTTEGQQLPDSGEQAYVVRGGSWFSPPEQVTCQAKELLSGLTSDPRIGFRLVVEGLPSSSLP